jgi:hypothetical protein
MLLIYEFGKYDYIGLIALVQCFTIVTELSETGWVIDFPRQWRWPMQILWLHHKSTISVT